MRDVEGGRRHTPQLVSLAKGNLLIQGVEDVTNREGWVCLPALTNVGFKNKLLL